MARVASAFLSLLTLVGAVLALLVIGRVEIVERVASRILVMEGVFGVDFDVEAFENDRIVLGAVDLGPGMPRADRLEVAFGNGGLIGGSVSLVRLSGLQLELVGDGQALRTRLERMLNRLGLGEPSNRRSSASALPEVIVEQAVMNLRDTALGDGVMRLNGAIAPDKAGREVGIVAALDMAELGARVSVISERLETGDRLRIQGQGNAAPSVLARAGLLDAGLEGGAITVEVNGGLEGAEALFDDPVEWLRRAPVAIETSIRAERISLAVAEERSEVTASAGFLLRRDGRLATLTLTRPALVAVKGIPADLLAQAYLVPPDLGEAGAEVSAAISRSTSPLVRWQRGPGGGSAVMEFDLQASMGTSILRMGSRLGLRHDAQGALVEPVNIAAEVTGSGFDLGDDTLRAHLPTMAWQGEGAIGAGGAVELRGPLSVHARKATFGAKAQAQDVRVEANVTLAVDAEGLLRAAAPGARLHIEGAEAPGTARLNEPLTAIFSTLEGQVSQGDYALTALADVQDTAATLLGSDGTTTRLRIAPGPIHIEVETDAGPQGLVRLDGSTVVLTGDGTEISDLTLTLPFGQRRAVAEAVSLSANIRDTGGQARFPPLALALDGQWQGRRIDLEGKLTGLRGALDVPLDLRLNRAQSSARVTYGPTTLRFERRGLQPQDLSSELANLTRTSGEVILRGRAVLQPEEGLSGGGSVRFRDVSVTSGDVSVEGLQGKIGLSQILPPVTAGQQRLVARRVTAAVPLGRTEVQFALLPRRRGLALRIDQASSALAGGTLNLRDVLWESRAETTGVDVLVENVSLERLLRQWQIEGISGTGQLSGRIPVSISPDGVAVEGGQLAAGSSGVIRVNWGSARDRLVQSGEQVELAVRALEDFRYSIFNLGIDQPPNGELTLSVGLTGQNPGVLDGFPFRFNVNFSGELNPILAAVREGRQIGNDLLQTTFE